MQIPISDGEQSGHRLCLRQFIPWRGKSSPKKPSFFLLLLFSVVQILCLGLVGHDCKTIHVVQNGDSCPTIAFKAKITVGELLIDNPNVDANCANINVGEVIKDFLFFFLFLLQPMYNNNAYYAY